ncbi:MAG: DUF169 domain-containing protein [Candidatus Nanopelagicales bacterium]
MRTLDTPADYAAFLQETEGYSRKVLGLKRTDALPEGAQSYDGVTFLCYEATAALESDGLTCISRDDVVCGGAVYCGLGSRRLSRAEFAAGLEMVVGPNRAYSTKPTMRHVNQQLHHYDEKHKYLVMGRLEEMTDPEAIMIITDPQHVMRLCKAYTWRTGELVHALGGTSWCGMSFPQVLTERTMTYNIGDPPSRAFMQLDDSEMFCVIHWDLVPLVVENLENVSTGEGY